MYFYTVQIAHPGGEATRRRVAADSITDARRLAYNITDDLGRPYSSVEVWR